MYVYIFGIFGGIFRILQTHPVMIIWNDPPSPTLPPQILHMLGAGGRKIVPRFLFMEFIEVYNFFSSQSNCA